MKTSKVKIVIKRAKISATKAKTSVHRKRTANRAKRRNEFVWFAWFRSINKFQPVKFAHRNWACEFLLINKNILLVCEESRIFDWGDRRADILIGAILSIVFGGLWLWIESVKCGRFWANERLVPRLGRCTTHYDRLICDMVSLLHDVQISWNLAPSWKITHGNEYV